MGQEENKSSNRQVTKNFSGYRDEERFKNHKNLVMFLFLISVWCILLTRFLCASSKTKVKGSAGFLLVFLDPDYNLCLSVHAQFKSGLSFGSCKHCLLFTVTWINFYPGLEVHGEAPISI